MLLKRSSFSSSDRNTFINAAIKFGGQVAVEAAGQQAEEADEMSIESDSPKALEAASAYYRILSALKLEISRLGTIDLLRRDYKEQTVHLSNDIKAGFSSVPVGLSEWIHERHGDGQDRWDGYFNSMREWMKQRSLDVAVVGTSFRDEEKSGKHKREL
jgi:exopolyphosphatase